MESMSRQECLDLLRFSKFGTLALQKDGETYNVPLFFGLGDDALFFQCHPGEKDEFLKTTKKACFAVCHLESDDIWESVVSFGSLEVLTINDEIKEAKAALLRIPFPPLEGNYPHGTPKRSGGRVYYLRMDLEEVTGRKSTFYEQGTRRPTEKASRAKAPERHQGERPRLEPSS